MSFCQCLFSQNVNTIPLQHITFKFIHSDETSNHKIYSAVGIFLFQNKFIIQTYLNI